jgi:hypothetical protein
VAVPDVIPIRREADYRTDTIGCHTAGQFFASVTGAFRGSFRHWQEGKEPMRWYSVLHLFDRAGNHARSDIWFAGTTADGQRETVQRAEEHLSAVLDDLPGRRYGDIAVRLFRVDYDGVVFGLIDESEPERGDWVELYPECLGFHEPWNGLYDT